jgi:hypothetical protein
VQRNPLNEQAWQKRLTEGIYDTVEHARNGQAAMSVLIARINFKPAVRDTVRSTAYNRCAGAMVIISRKNGANAT